VPKQVDLKIVNLLLHLLSKTIKLKVVSHSPLRKISSSKHLFKVITENLLFCREETKQEMNKHLFLTK